MSVVLEWGFHQLTRNHSLSNSRANTVFQIALTYVFVTARKWSLRRLCFNTCLSVILFMGGIPTCTADGIPACLAAGLGGGGIPACLAGFQAHTQGGGSWEVWPEGSPGPHPGGLQAHTWGVSRPTPGVSRPTPRGSTGTHPGGVSQHALT